MRTRNLKIWAVCVAFALTGCSRCGKSGGTSASAGGLAAHVPKDALGAVFLPDLTRLGKKLTQLQGMTVATFAAQLQGFTSAQQYVDAVVAQAGVDPRSADSMRDAGLAPEKGLAVAELGPGREAVIVGVSDEKKLEAWLSTQARNRLGATKTDHPTVDGVKETVFASSAGPVLVTAWVDGYALLARGAEIPALPQLTKLAAADSLAQDAAFASATKPLPSDRDVLAYAPARSPLVDPNAAPDGAAMSVNLAPDALVARIFLPRPHAPQEVQAFQKVDSDDLSWMFEPGAILRLRTSVDPSRFAGIWQRYVPGRVNLALTAAGVDVDHQVLGNLKPGGVMEISLAPSVNLSSGLPTLDFRRTDPFRFVQLRAAENVKDPKLAAQVIDQIASHAPQFQAQMDKTTLDGSPAWLTRYSMGEGVDLALVGNTFVVGGPRASFDAARARVTKHDRTPSVPFADALSQPAVGFVIDLHQLADSVRALPSSAWGLGGFAIKATTMRWLDALHELSAVTGGVSGEQGGLSVDVAVRFSAK